MSEPGPVVWVEVVATRWISDEPIPGIVEIELIDAADEVWVFRDKTAMFDGADKLTVWASYPIRLAIPCVVLERIDTGRLRVSTAVPLGVETIDGVHEFTVSAARVRSHE